MARPGYVTCCSHCQPGLWHRQGRNPHSRRCNRQQQLFDMQPQATDDGSDFMPELDISAQPRPQEDTAFLTRWTRGPVDTPAPTLDTSSAGYVYDSAAIVISDSDSDGLYVEEGSKSGTSEACTKMDLEAMD